VGVLDDTIYEGDETFTVTLSGEVGASLGSPSTATVTILDNDPRPVRFTLTTNVYPNGSGSINLNPPPDGDGKYATGTVVMLTADANVGYIFNFWSGDLNGSVNPHNITMTDNKTVTANFTSTTNAVGLVAYYPFDGNANDMSGNGHDGAVHGVAPTKDRFGVDNKAYAFDGTNSSITVEGIALANTNLSVAFWSKRLSDNAGFVVSHGYWTAHGGLHVGYRPSSGGKFTFAFYLDDLDTTANHMDLDGRWHFWAVTFDAMSRARVIYKDGVPVANDTASANYAGIGTLTIGRAWDTTYYFQGMIDEVRIYNQLLSSDGIWGLYWGSNAPPAKAVDPSPASGETGVSIDTLLSWQNGGGATSYDVYFGTTPAPGVSQFKTNQTATTFDPGTLNYNTTYYWRIDAKNSAGTIPGQVWSFTSGSIGGLWSGATDAGHGWKYLTWFGFFSDQYAPWIYHVQHEWFYPVGQTTDSIWFYPIDGMGWLWTSRTVYPWFYQYNRNCWLYYQKGSSHPRWFFNWNTGRWESH
jgi:hypothetical protein